MLILDPLNVEKVKNFNFPLFWWEFSDFKFDRFDFKSEKWSFLTKIFCFKSPKKVAHQISYGSRSLLNFLWPNRRQKISPISKVRTFGFELLTKIKDPGLCVCRKNFENFFRLISKKITFLKSALRADFKNVIFFQIGRKFFFMFQRPGSLIFVKSSKPKVRTFETGEIFLLWFVRKKFSRLCEP